MPSVKQDLPLSVTVNTTQHGLLTTIWLRHRIILVMIWLSLVGIGCIRAQRMSILESESFMHSTTSPYETFYSNVTPVLDLCPGPSLGKRVISHAGHIGLKGDIPARPKRSFFWYFEAENNPENAPVILVTGGGPGTSGLTGPLIGQSPCGITENGIQFNPSRWTEHFNLIALDHPIGVGFSYGERVNNSRDAAFDVYDFLQKFFRIFPRLEKNQFVLSGGSYGGIYMPNIATVIHDQNLAISKGQGPPEAKYINLESIMISNPITNPLAHFSWLLQYRCGMKHVYNETACPTLYASLPTCLESIHLAFENSTVENRVAALQSCDEPLLANTNGTVLEDVTRKCDNPNDVPDTKQKLNVPNDLNFTALSQAVGKDFSAYGDLMQPHHLLYTPLLRDGIRLLHYIGADDANCAWPGVLSFLKLLQSSYQEEFLTAQDKPWPSAGNENRGTARVVGSGAGKMTYILLNDAGHFVVHDQSALVKNIVDRWIPNKPFFDE